MDDTFDQHIARAIHARAEEVATEQLRRITERMDRDHEEAKRRIEKLVRDDVGRIACLLVRDLRFERIGQDLRITVRFPEGKEPGQ